ncbi:hypothetical protein SAMN02745975_01774 [Geosporobacter subterraneus DSM 17957]|uniref:Uncharacterized protein n=1 Tax=Geosporobacter subterraneus DSM 17957 TaxID=1121919 RepID=A0A1M6I9E0_9FIRM|nr:hypothetical protein [Geosporobacter subterraneus]SHJ31129.1 hypothetical protein SAMN02745975_01774 [Geosporobacter subterraneus DSM 17957]
MKRILHMLGNDNYFVISLSVASLFAFLLLNVAAIVVYIRYLLGISSSFISLLPAVKILLNVDFIFVVVLIFIYNTIENFFGLKAVFAAITVISIVEALYLLMKDKPFAIISLLALYGFGVSIFTSFVGLDTMIRIANKSVKAK